MSEPRRPCDGFVQLCEDAWVFFPLYPPFRGYITRSRTLRDEAAAAMQRIHRWSVGICVGAVAAGVIGFVFGLVGAVFGFAGAVITVAALLMDLTAWLASRRLVRRMVALSVPLSLAAYALGHTDAELSQQATSHLVSGGLAAVMGHLAGDPVMLASCSVFVLWGICVAVMVVWRQRAV